MMQSHESSWTDRRTGQNLFYRTLPATARGPIKNPKNDISQKKLKYELKKLINIHIIQVRFMKILKISTIKSIKISSKNHTKKYWDAKYMKLQDTKHNENECKTMQNFSNFW